MATKSVTGYRWLSKDPVLDLFKAAKAATGKSNTDIARNSGVTEATLRKWDFGDTRKPQHITLVAAMLACGYEEAFRNHRTGDMLAASYAKPNRPPKKKKAKAPTITLPATPT